MKPQRMFRLRNRDIELKKNTTALKGYFHKTFLYYLLNNHDFFCRHWTQFLFALLPPKLSSQGLKTKDGVFPSNKMQSGVPMRINTVRSKKQTIGGLYGYKKYDGSIADPNFDRSDF